MKQLTTLQTKSLRRVLDNYQTVETKRPKTESLLEVILRLRRLLIQEVPTILNPRPRVTLGKKQMEDLRILLERYTQEEEKDFEQYHRFDHPYVDLKRLQKLFLGSAILVTEEF